MHTIQSSDIDPSMTLPEIAVCVMNKPELLQARIDELVMRQRASDNKTSLKALYKAQADYAAQLRRLNGLLVNMEKQKNPKALAEMSKAAESMRAKLGQLEQAATPTDEQQDLLDELQAINRKISQVVVEGKDTDGSAYEDRVAAVLMDSDIHALFGIPEPFEIRTNAKFRGLPEQHKKEFDILVGVTDQDGTFKVLVVLECKFSFQLILADLRKFQRGIDHLVKNPVDGFDFSEARLVYVASKDFQGMLAPKQIYSMMRGFIADNIINGHTESEAVDLAIQDIDAYFCNEYEGQEDSFDARVLNMQLMLENGHILLCE